MKPVRQNSWQRPRTLREVVAWANSNEDLGINLAEFLDEWNAGKKGGACETQLLARIRGEPAPAGNAVHDAYLAAVAAHLAHSLHRAAPRWTWKKNRRLKHPWFALPYDWARAGLLRDSPAAFRERNIFTTEDALMRV